LFVVAGTLFAGEDRGTASALAIDPDRRRETGSRRTLSI